MTCDDTKCLPPSDLDFDLIATKKSPMQKHDQDGGEASNGETKKDASGSEIPNGNDDPNIDLTFEDMGITGFPSEQSDGMVDPVKWTVTYQEATKDEVIFIAKIEEGWHIYAQEIAGDDGPIPTEFWIAGEKKLLPLEAEYTSEEKDEFFGGIMIKKIKKEAKYTYTLPEEGTDDIIEGELFYMACDKSKCTAPMEMPFIIDRQTKTVYFTQEEDLNEAEVAGLYPIEKVDLNKPVGQCGDIATANVAKNTLLNIFFLGFFGGLIALLTPCVFPMIPLTVSFFTKGSENRKAGMRQAFLYGFFILLTYLLLSLPFHLLDTVNPGILNDISTNVVLNLAFFAIFIFFAFSFFGFYELTIPSKWTNKVSNAESVGGVLGVFFMALTLALVSFSCTGPILGTLLAGALTSEGGAMQLTAGMGGFGLALALPFALFAAFPTMLSTLPKSGGWLNTVKVVLGFIELGLAFKFLSNADLVKRWGLLKIEPFLVVWIVISIGLAIYLFGKWKFPHDSPIKKISPVRLGLGALTVAFALYLISGFRYDTDKGTFRSLTLLSGLAPPVGYSWLYPKKCPNNLDCFKDLAEGLSYAAKVNKPIMIDFTGHACVNCRKMEEHVWSEKSVDDRLKNDLVLISLYVDEKIDLPEDEKSGKIKTYGNKWSAFQAEYFNNNSQPYYVLLSPDGQLLTNPVGYTPDVAQYTEFLECGIAAFAEMQGKTQLGSAK
jgi:thiol:disulfide interchange protein DsbD